MSPGNDRSRPDEAAPQSARTTESVPQHGSSVEGAAYGTSRAKRVRRTNDQLQAVDTAILTALREEHPATLRGTFYRVMSAGAVSKDKAGYDLVGRQVLKLRRVGILPYSWITDGTRYIVKPTTWSDLDEMLDDAAASYRRMLWDNQDTEVQLFTEKDAITGVIYDVTAEWDVPLGVLRGYASESFAWSVAESLSLSKRTMMYQLGDHDPSGVDAWRNFEEKVTAFAPKAEVVFERIAVTPAQIDLLDLPTRPTKTTDSRAAGFAGESVEVDAIPPSILRAIVRVAIEQHIDPDALEFTRSVEASERAGLQSLLGGRS